MSVFIWCCLALIAAWLAAFAGIKIYDLGCATNPFYCVIETGHWLRNLVLLEWAYRWQTLLSGVCALMAGGFVLFAAKLQILNEHNKLISLQRQKTNSDIFNAFHSIVQLGPIWKVEFKEKTVYVEKSIESIRSLNYICGELTLDILYTLFQLRISDKNFNNENKAYMLCYTNLLGLLSQALDKQKGYPKMIFSSELQLDYRSIDHELQDHGLSIDGLDRIKKYCDPNYSAKL